MDVASLSKRCEVSRIFEAFAVDPRKGQRAVHDEVRYSGRSAEADNLLD
jgi:hypothetical protein